MLRYDFCLWWLTACLLLAGCRQQEYTEEGNAVYFWRTTFSLSTGEHQFLADHHISRIYCRYFDVVDDERSDEPHPNATLAFIDRFPAGVEIIPTVYITEDCMHEHHEGLARKVVDRIVQMNRTNGVEGIGELQMDCDYTARSRQTYYDFLSEVRREAQAQGMRLSATIRLHQLSMSAPPVDYGVLMLYNTGDPRHFEERNPVLDIRDVRPYARQLPSYPLPLAAAYPVYRWVRQVQGVQIEHEVDADEILQVKALVEEKRPSLCQTIITYCLDEDNIDRYNPQTYEAIYHH